MENINKTKIGKNQQLSVKPFVYTRPSLSRICIRILILLSLQIILLFVTKSYNSIFVILSSVIGAIGASIINQIIYKEQPYQIMSIIIQGIFIGLLLPQNYPLLTVFFLSFITLLVSRCMVFKSINSWINVSVLAVIIAWIVGKTFFPDFVITSEIIPLKNSSLYLIQNGDFPIYEFDSSITEYLNTNLFTLFGISIPDGFISLLVDSKSSIPAFRFNLLTIISSIILFSDNSFSGIIPILFLFVYGLLVRIFAPFIFGGLINQGDVILAFFTSGTLFCTVFLLQWFGTIPITILGKIILGILSGIYAFLIMGCGTSPIGMVYTVLLTNISCMLIRVIEEKNNTFMNAKVIHKLASKGVQK